MKTLAVILGCLSLLATGCNRQKAQGEKLTVHSEADISANTKAQQTRIAGAFYEALLPKLKNCWSRVEGKGEVEFKLTYEKNGDKWEWRQAEVAKSDLPDASKTAALDCMQNASRGTAFPMNNNEAVAAQKQFVIQWGWPVPFPPETSTLALMISTGGGGSGECPKNCYDCQGTPGVPGSTKCVRTCSGYQTCVEDGTGDGCKLTPVGGQCATGWSGEWNGVFIAANSDRPKL